MTIRPYGPGDGLELAELFARTVRAVNARDYTQEQLDAWISGAADLEAWQASFSRHVALVAVEGERITGFGDLDPSGYLDRLYVHKDFQRRGIASALCGLLEAFVRGGAVTVHASITARPFFERRGYEVRRRQQVLRRGVSLANCVMEKPLPHRRDGAEILRQMMGCYRGNLRFCPPHRGALPDGLPESLGGLLRLSGGIQETMPHPETGQRMDIGWMLYPGAQIEEESRFYRAGYGVEGTVFSSDGAGDPCFLKADGSVWRLDPAGGEESRIADSLLEFYGG